MSLKFKSLQIQEFIKKYSIDYAESKPKNPDLESFKEKLKEYLLSFEKYKKENEGSIVSKPLSNFFENLGFYSQSSLKQKGNSEIDLVLLKDNEVEVIIEAKKPENTSEMFRGDNPNCKALHECILYYLREREKSNTSLKYIIITNFTQFFIFRAMEFEELFYKNKKIKNAYESLEKEDLLRKQGDFYNELSKILNTEFNENSQGEIANTLQGVSFNLCDDKQLDKVYKILNRSFLHSEFSGDSNALNPRFYFELLHILGLRESSQKGKILILIDDSQKIGFARYIFNKISEERERLSIRENEVFEKMMGHIILWLNRILFLKLIEANLLHFNNFDKNLKFLTASKIKRFSTLSHLFFEVLAKEYEKRESDKGFNFLPYLNSSLFIRDKEEILDLSALDDDLKIMPYAQSKVEHKSEKTSFLAYLFNFLEYWDFGKSTDVARSDKLINSSVLGAMFEKLNGYKEGSFYTPNFITSFMCKESLRKIVIDRFNARFSWRAKDLEGLRTEIDRNFHKVEKDPTNEEDFNKPFEKIFKKLLEDIRICDPSVGSGHFLVSCLNEMIYIYHRLGLLGFGYKNLEIVDDEIILITRDGEKFAYRRFDDNNHKIQVALFDLKKTIIENNLFGVDINPHSCNIARLRLWIELLKSAYYLNFSKDKDSNIHKLQTLPNIDINIKFGNSLISYFDINQDLSHYPNIKERMQKYKQVVQNYKDGGVDYDKSKIDKQIRDLLHTFKNFCFKDKFKKEIENFERKCDKYSKKYGNYLAEDNEALRVYIRQIMFIDGFDEQEAQKQFEILKKEFESIFNLESNNPFEWRFAFPEVLDGDGTFLGFDLVIGNPPYIRQEEIKHLKPHLQKAFSIYKGTSDIYTYFFEQGYKILKNGGILSFITSNKWCRAGYGEALRGFLLEKATINKYIDFNGVKVFESASVDTSILELCKGKAPQGYAIEYANPRDYNPRENKPLELVYSKIPQDSLSKESFIFADSALSALKKKIERIGTPLKDWDISIYRGILTGYNEAFIITSEKREEILVKCDDSDASLLPYPLSEYDKNLDSSNTDKDGILDIENNIIFLNEKQRTAQLIKPILRGRDIKRYSYEWAGLWVIFISWHFPNTNNQKSMQENEQDLAEQYPSLYSHLLQHKDKLSKRNKDETGIRYEWYCLQRWGANYYQEFSKQKIVYSEIVREPQFYLDNGEFKFGYFYAEATSFILSGNEKFRDSLKYLLGILHSKLAAFAFKEFYAGGGLGENGYRYKKAFLEKLPIPKISQEQAKEFVALIDNIIESKQLNNPINHLEKELNSKVFALYGLSDEEIALIGGGIVMLYYSLQVWNPKPKISFNCFVKILKANLKKPLNFAIA